VERIEVGFGTDCGEVPKTKAERAARSVDRAVRV
jgi:hypothetical protein